MYIVEKHHYGFQNCNEVCNDFVEEKDDYRWNIIRIYTVVLPLYIAKKEKEKKKTRILKLLFSELLKCQKEFIFISPRPC